MLKLFTRAIAAAAILLACLTPAHAQERAKRSNDLPDLIIKKIKVDADDNEVKVEVKNVGRADAGPFAVRLTIFAGRFPVFVQAKALDKLKDGSDKDVKFNVNFAQVNANAQRFARLPGFSAKLRAVALADANRQVREANEGNNTLTQNVP